MTMIHLLNIDEVREAASRRFRYSVTERHVRAWLANGLPADPLGADVLVRSDILDEYLTNLEPQEKLLTVSEAVERLKTDHALTVSRRAVIDWCTRGCKLPTGRRAVLATTHCPWFKPTIYLIRPRDLQAYVRLVPTLGRVGWPQGLPRRKKKKRKG